MPRTALQYDDFAVRLEAAEGNAYLARILHSVAGGGSTTFQLPLGPAAIDELLAGVGARVRASAGDRHVTPLEPMPSDSSGAHRLSADPERLGRTLHDAALGGRVGEAWAFHLGSLAREQGRGLRLRLVFDPSNLATSILPTLPWELIFPDRARGYLAQDRRTPVIRHLDVEHPTVLPPIERPLRVLVVVASPTGYPPLQLAKEVTRIRAAWGKETTADVDVVRRITLEQLRERLLREAHHVLHFMGHGEFLESGPDLAEGALVFEGPARRPERVPAKLFSDSLRGLEQLRLVVLNACDTARFPRRLGVDPYSSAGAALVLAGIPAVVAMQFPISDRAAIAFGGGIYRALSANDSVDGAVAEGRLAILQDNSESLEWATPVLFSRIASGALLGSLDEATPAALRDRMLDFSTLVEEKSRSFVGRRFVFDTVDAFRSSARRGYFQIVAEPGIGKSTLMAEMVRRHGWVHHFNQRATNVTRPEAFLANVCAQLIVAHNLEIPDLPTEAVRDGNFLCRILSRISRRLEPEATTVILIDALDESSRDGLAPGVNPLYLPASLPEGIIIILTTRPERPERSPRIDGPTEILTLDPRSAENLNDVREYVESFLPRPGVQQYIVTHGLSEEGFADEMTRRSEGNFMYVSYLLPDIERGAYENRPLRNLPVGLLNYYRDQFTRMRGRDREIWLHETLPVLGALTVARGALPFEHIHAFSNVKDPRRVLDTLQELWPFLSVGRRETPAGPVRVYSLYHETFFEFIRDSPEVALDPRQAHRRIAEAYLDGRLDGLEDLGDLDTQLSAG